MTQRPWFPALILGTAILLSSVIATMTWASVRNDHSLSTVGSAKVSVRSDLAKWSLSMSRGVPESQVQSGYAKVQSDVKAVSEYITKAGIPAEGITVDPIAVSEYVDYSNTNRASDAPRMYTVAARIIVQSPDVEKIASLAQGTGSLLGSGILVSTDSLEYYYSKLPELRVSLLGAALSDAKARATEIAKASGATVGVLRTASSGVVQVMAPNSVNSVDDYGSYDTSSIEKEVSVTVRAAFLVK